MKVATSALCAAAFIEGDLPYAMPATREARRHHGEGALAVMDRVLRLANCAAAGSAGCPAGQCGSGDQDRRERTARFMPQFLLPVVDGFGAPLQYCTQRSPSACTQRCRVFIPHAKPAPPAAACATAVIVALQTRGGSDGMNAQTVRVRVWDLPRGCSTGC